MLELLAYAICHQCMSLLARSTVGRVRGRSDLADDGTDHGELLRVLAPGRGVCSGGGQRSVIDVLRKRGTVRQNSGAKPILTGVDREVMQGVKPDFRSWSFFICLLFGRDAARR